MPTSGTTDRVPPTEWFRRPSRLLKNWGNYVVTPGGMGLEHHLLRQPVVVGGVQPNSRGGETFKEEGRPSRWKDGLTRSFVHCSRPNQ